MERIDRKARLYEERPKWSLAQLKYALWWIGLQYSLFTGSYVGEPLEVFLESLTILPLIGWIFYSLCCFLISLTLYMTYVFLQFFPNQVYQVNFAEG